MGHPRRNDGVHRGGCQFKRSHAIPIVCNVDDNAGRVAHTCRLEGGHWGGPPCEWARHLREKHIFRAQREGQRSDTKVTM